MVPGSQDFSQLPRMLDHPRRADGLVPTEDDERRETALVGALCVRQAVLEGVLRRQERHDPLARHVGPEVGDEMPQVVLFLRANGAVGQEDKRPLARQTSNRVVRVNPRVHPFVNRQLGARRTELGRVDRLVGSKCCQEIGNHGYRRQPALLALSRACDDS